MLSIQFQARLKMAQSLESEEPVPKAAKTTAKNNNIKDAWTHLESGKWTISKFLDEISYFPQQVGKYY